MSARYAVVNGPTVENVVVATATPVVPGRVVVGPLTTQQAAGPGDSYDGTNFTPRVPTAQELTHAAAPGRLTAGYPVLRQWAIDAAALQVAMGTGARSMTAAEEREVVRRFGLLMDFLADLLVHAALDS